MVEVISLRERVDKLSDRRAALHDIRTAELRQLAAEISQVSAEKRVSRAQSGIIEGHNYKHPINGEKLEEGWYIIGDAHINMDYFVNRHIILEESWSNEFYEERSHYFGSGKPIMVFYGRRNPTE